MNERGFNIKNKILAFEICTQNKIIRDKLEIKNEYDLIYKIKRKPKKESVKVNK